jgi:inner membrane protein
MDVVQYFSEHHASLLYLLGTASLILELTVMGMGGPLLFFAIACLATGGLVSAGLVSGWQTEVVVVVALTLVSAVALWKPIKNFQNSGDGADNSSDMIGRRVPCSSKVTATGGSVRYSGINWNSRLASDCPVDSIAEGTLCEITGVTGNVMEVVPAGS